MTDKCPKNAFVLDTSRDITNSCNSAFFLTNNHYGLFTYVINMLSLLLKDLCLHYYL